MAPTPSEAGQLPTPETGSLSDPRSSWRRKVVLDQEYRAHDQNAEKNSSVIATPTGCAAFHAAGSTLHSLFRLSTKSEKESAEIDQQKLIRLQKAFEHLNVLQIDEFSMVGKGLLGKTQHIVSLSYPESSSPSFGSIPIVIMYGDWCQLPPVLDKPRRQSIPIVQG